MIRLPRELLWIGLFWTTTLMATEEPKFETLRKDGKIEIRRYAPLIVAETWVDGDMASASGTGFRRIASYIFGDNAQIAMTVPVVAEPQQRAEKIAMTTPVTIEPQLDDISSFASARRWRIHFVMPSQYTLVTLPKPLNAEVQLREIPARIFAALTYSGTTNEVTAQEKSTELLNWLRAQQIETIGSPQLARYNPPWTLPFLRRNENLQEIRFTAP